MKKVAFVQNRVDLEVTRALRSGPSVSAVSQRAPPAAKAVTARSARGFFEDDDDDYDDDAPAGREPDYVDEIFLNRLGLDAAQVLAIQLKIGKGKGGGKHKAHGESPSQLALNGRLSDPRPQYPRSCTISHDC